MVVSSLISLFPYSDPKWALSRHLEESRPEFVMALIRVQFRNCGDISSDFLMRKASVAKSVSELC